MGYYRLSVYSGQSRIPPKGDSYRDFLSIREIIRQLRNCEEIYRVPAVYLGNEVPFRAEHRHTGNDIRLNVRLMYGYQVRPVARHACLLSRKSLYVSDANELPSPASLACHSSLLTSPRTESRASRWFTVPTSVRRRQLLYSSDPFG